MLQIRRDLHNTQRLRLSRAINNRGGLRRAYTRHQIDFEISMD